MHFHLTLSETKNSATKMRQRYVKHQYALPTIKNKVSFGS